MNVVVIGRSDTLYNCIEHLSDNFNIVLIIISDFDQEQYHKTENDFETLSNNLNIDFIKTNNLGSVSNKIKKYNPDIGISINWKYLISNEIINLFSKGILNAHPGKLPRYRGNSARNWALINGEKLYSQTIHFMDNSLDSGPIFGSERFCNK